MKMPFGKYKGQQIEDIPDDYLRWCLENCNLDSVTCAEMEAQLGARNGEGIARQKGFAE